MKIWLSTILIISLIALRDVNAQDDFDDEDEDIMVDDDFDAEEEQPEINLPKKERPVYSPPKPKGGVHFADAFVSEDIFNKRWTKSQATKDGADDDIAKYDGQWSIEEPEENPLKNDLSLVLMSKAKHHAVAAKLDRPFQFSGKPFIVQYEVKFQTGQDCGGAYIKLLSDNSKLNLKQITDKTPYTIMFGPDKCGNDEKLHFIFRHKNPKTGEFEEKHAKKPASVSLTNVFSDKKTHLLKLVVNPDNAFEVYLDEDMAWSGNLLEDVDPAVNPKKEIEDPQDKKPDDWDEREKIPDPEASKPEDWDESAPEYIEDESAEMPEGWLEDLDELIHDPDAEKPADWDDDMDGEWEAPMISNAECEAAPGCGPWSRPQIKNPEYKGKWKAPKIDNPNYKGKWKPRMILNPDFFEDLEPYKMTPIGAVALELWSMSNGIAFDNFLVTDDKSVADQWTQDTWQLKHTQELDSASSSGQSVVDAVMEMTDERPWLWAVILVVLVLPIVLLIAYCCSGGSSSKPDEAAERKKTDAPSPDDKPSTSKAAQGAAEESTEEEEEDDDQGEEEGAGDAKASPKASPKKGASPKKSAKKPSKSDLDAANEEADAEEADAEEDDAEQEKATRSSPRKRTTRARKD